MPRPCRGCERGAPFLGEFDITRQCKICWLYYNNQRYRELWDKTQGQAVEEREKQTFSKRIVKFVYAMKIETLWRSQGGLAPTAEEKAHRRSLCNTCDAHSKEDDMCTLCGCYLEAGLLPPRPFGKIDCASQACPKGLWTYTSGFVPKAECSPCGKKKAANSA